MMRVSGLDAEYVKMRDVCTVERVTLIRRERCEAFKEMLVSKCDIALVRSRGCLFFRESSVACSDVRAALGAD